MDKLVALHLRYQRLRDRRRHWETAWRLLAENFLPTRWRSDDDDTATDQPILNTGLMDPTGVLGMRTLAAGMQGGMTSPVRPWFRLEFQAEAQDDNHAARVWLDDVTRRMQTALHRSNFYNAIHTLYADIGTFGTGCLIELADHTGLKFYTLRAGEYVVDIGADNSVDLLIRRLHMTARQMEQEFGLHRLPDVVKRCLERERGKRETERFNVFQAILPASEYRNVGGKSIASVYYTDRGGFGGKPHLLRESGFESFPAFVPRWDIAGEDVYGRSPAMDVLSDCMMLQSMGRTLIKSMHKMADPPMSADASLRSVGLDLRPSALNYVDWAGRSGQPVAAAPIMQVDPRSVQASLEAREDVRRNINSGLYSDLFKMLIANDRRNITATEIEAREQEKMILIGPVVERLHKELFSPLIARTFDLMRQWDYLPPAPAGMEGAAIKVDFVSVLAQAQRMVSTSGIDQTLAFAANAGQILPEVLDSIDPDKLMDAYTEALGVNKSILRGADEREAVRAQRAEAQARIQAQAESAQGVQNIQGMANAAKSLGQTPTGADGMTAMDALLGSLGEVS